MKITRWGEYGILCSLYLARAGESKAIGASEIAQAQAMPLQYTQQVLHRLRKGGIVQSVRGPRGGFRLAKTPEATTLREVLYAAEGATFQVICDVDPVNEKFCHSAGECGLHTVWQQLKTTIDTFLDSKTLGDLLNEERISGRRHVFQELVPGPHAYAHPK